MEKDKGADKTEDKEMEGELRVYEVSYLLLPFITEEDAPKEAGRVKEYVSLSGGAVFSEEEPKLIKLAYPMSKVIANKNTNFENAYFGWAKFEGEPEGILKIKKALENNENVLRFLILKTTKEVLAPRKPFPFIAKSVKPMLAVTDDASSKIEAPQEINEVELDKTIDDLVIE